MCWNSHIGVMGVSNGHIGNIVYKYETFFKKIKSLICAIFSYSLIFYISLISHIIHLMDPPIDFDALWDQMTDEFF
jgi:hypothetical protein